VKIISREDAMFGDVNGRIFQEQWYHHRGYIKI
jgi:hypothetical protein